LGLIRFWLTKQQLNFSKMAEFLLLIVILMMVPKIINGVKEGIKFAGRVIGWCIAGVIIIFLIKTFYL